MKKCRFAVVVLCLLVLSGLPVWGVPFDTDAGSDLTDFSDALAEEGQPGGHALQVQWNSLSTMLQAIYYHAVVQDQDMLYSVGGYTTSETNLCWSYDISNDLWSPIANMPTAKGHVAAAVVGGKIYVPGGSSSGYTAVTTNYEYDIGGNTWATVAPIPTATCFHGAVAWRDTLIYCVGGVNGTTYYNLVQVYDPANDSWSSATALPTTNRSLGIGISGDTIFVVGGWNGAYIASTYIGAINPADPSSITWTMGTDMPNGPSGQAGRSRVAATGLRGLFYFTCGDDHGVAAYDTWEYDPVGDLWTPLPDKITPVSNCQNFVAVPGRGGLYSAGGYNTNLGAGTNVTEVLAGLSLTHDVAADAIDSPGALVAPNVPVTPCATFGNHAVDSTEDFWTYFFIDSSAVNVYADSALIIGLMPESTETVCYTDWTPDGQGNVYDVLVYSDLPTDEARSNDTLRATVLAYAVDSLIEAGWAYAPATIDGTIDSLEWSSADVTDISDILGMSSGGVLPNSVILYVMNNDSHVFFAVDYTIDATDNVNDRTILYLDEDNDDAWAPDSSEGSYWAFMSSGGPQLWFAPLPAGPFFPNPPGAEVAMGLPGHVTYEFSIPLGTEKYEIDAALGDTMGVHIFVRDQGINEDEGWWLQTMDPLNQEDPLYYGGLVLHTLVGVQERSKERSATAFGLVGAYPSPFSGKTSISFATEARTRVSLKVYDVTGRVVRELLDGIADPGYHTVTWTGTDDTGNELPSGVYFYRLHSAGKSSWIKTVLLK